MTTRLRAAFVLLLVASSAGADPITLSTLELALDAPSGTKVDANPHHDYVELRAKGFLLQVRKASDVANTKVEEREIRHTMHPTELASEKLANGFIIRYTTMTHDKKRYMLRGFRITGGAGYNCDAGADTRASIEIAAAACRSMRKVPRPYNFN